MKETAFSTEVPYLIVRFPIQGKHLPADHGYPLYSALAEKIPKLHGARWFALELISGAPRQDGIITLSSRGAWLRLRIPAHYYATVLPLAGKRLDINGHAIRLGLPITRPLTASPSLYARCVTIKKFTEAGPLLEAARRQMVALGIEGVLVLPLDEQGRFRRRILTIQGKRIVGFSLAAHRISDGDSLRLQSIGLGGRRAMGCGIFNPILSRKAADESI